MKRKEDRPISKHTLNLFEGDYARIQSMYPRIGAGKIIRDLVARHIRATEERYNQRRPTVEDLPLDIQELVKEVDPVSEL